MKIVIAVSLFDLRIGKYQSSYEIKEDEEDCHNRDRQLLHFSLGQPREFLREGPDFGLFNILFPLEEPSNLKEEDDQRNKETEDQPIVNHLQICRCCQCCCDALIHCVHDKHDGQCQTNR